jgi:protoheme IX farnesyltransferase
VAAFSKALVALTKPRLALFSVLSAMSAYAVARSGLGALHALVALAGIAMAAGGALSLNQWWERGVDGRMRRTRDRPLPAGTIDAEVALGWSLGLAGGGVLWLALLVNLLSAAIAALIIVLYGLVYTPLKRRSRWATEIGSIAGALPPILGAAAAGAWDAAPAWVLAGIILFWQMPHFFAIGWVHREDYRAAGFRLLPAIDRDGERTARASLAYALALVLISSLPWALGRTGSLFGATATLGAGWILWAAWRFARAADDRDPAARRLFLATILHLPVIMAAMVAS